MFKEALRIQPFHLIIGKAHLLCCPSSSSKDALLARHVVMQRWLTGRAPGAHPAGGFAGALGLLLRSRAPGPLVGRRRAQRGIHCQPPHGPCHTKDNIMHPYTHFGLILRGRSWGRSRGRVEQRI